jgi:hypothetical protein
MKTFTTTLALVLTATVMMAYPSASRLTVELAGHRPNTMILIDGQTYNAANNLVRLEGMMPGDHQVQLMRPSSWRDHGVLFKGVIRIPQRSDVLAVITPQGMKVKAQPMAHHGGSYWDGNGSHGNGATVTPNANGNGGFVSMLPHHQPVFEPVVCAPVVIGMHPDVFASALRSIELQSFDSDQVRVAKQIIRTNGASSHQIAQIMELLSFESSRLEIAKFGYQFVGDPENYFIVNDVFWFSSSVRELDRFINRY